MTTPFQRISGKLVKAKIFKNKATINFNMSSYDWQTGELVDLKIQRDVLCYPPEPVNQRLVDGKNYLSTDQIMRIPYTELVTLMADRKSDPAIMNNGKRKSLSEMRPFDPVNGGISTAQDTITFCGKEYRIAAVRGDSWMNNEPADYYFTLRS